MASQWTHVTKDRRQERDPKERQLGDRSASPWVLGRSGLRAAPWGSPRCATTRMPSSAGNIWQRCVLANKTVRRHGKVSMLANLGERCPPDCTGGLKTAQNKES